MNDNKEVMTELREFLMENKITNLTTDAYTKDWNKTIAITAYAETKEESKLLDNYKGNFAIESFHIKPLKWFNKNRPNFIIGYMIGWKNFRKDTFFKKYDFICININIRREL